MKRGWRALVAGGVLLWTLEASALPWPSRASWNYCIEVGFAALTVASIRDRSPKQGFTIETAREALTLNSAIPRLDSPMREWIITEVYPSTMPQDKVAQHYAMACVKRYGVKPPELQRPVVIILPRD